MKKLFFFLAVTSTALFTSCSSDDDSTTPPPVVEEGVTAIDLTSNVSTITLGGSFNFTVKDQDGNILPTVTLTVNGTAITNPWMPDAVGTYTVNAAFETFTDALTITVNAIPQTENTFTVDGAEFITDRSAFIYLGTDENNINNWIAFAAKTDETGSHAINRAMIYFTNTQVNEQYLDFPTTGNFTFTETAPGTVDAEFGYDDTDIVNTGSGLIQSLNLNIISIAVPETEGEPQTWNYTYDLTLTDGTVVIGNFNGDWQFENAAGRPGRNTNAGKQVVRLSNAQIKQNLTNYLKK